MMLATVSQDSAFSTEWMSRNKILKEALPQAQDFASAETASEATSSSSDQAAYSGNTVGKGGESSQSKSSTDESEASKNAKSDEDTTELTTEEKREVSHLQATDRNVRAHEQAHLSAAQGLAVSGASYDYHTGPDDKRYAVAGEVNIDTSKESDPEKTIAKGHKIIRAALAPTSPSPQDRAVASSAERMILDAQAELVRESYALHQQIANSQQSGEIIDQQV